MSGRVEETRVVINVWEFRGCHWSMQGHLIVSGRKEEEEERGRGHYKKNIWGCRPTVVQDPAKRRACLVVSPRKLATILRR